MQICNQCGKEFDEQIALGICPYCGTEVQSQSKINDEVKAGDDPRWLQPGMILHDRYLIEKVIGAGGFGISYKVLDQKTGVFKAVKEYFQQGVVNRVPGTKEVLITASKRKEEFEYGKERLLLEAQIVAKFQSANIVKVDDYFEENNTSYMVMEYLESQTLEDFVIARKGVLEPDEAIRLGVGICEALEEIHAAGIVHRDIAPDNIFVDNNGHVKVIDFGSARLSKEDMDDRLIVLKPGFAPPEQYEKIDPKNDRQKAWTDVYALGAILYFCLTGIIPAESSDRKADYDEHKDRVCYPQKINPHIPDFLNNTIMTAMAINIHERFQNATELKKALLQERKVLPVEKVRQRKRFKRTAGIGTSLLLVALLTSYGVHHYQERRQEAVLEAADITIWYSLDNDEELQMQKDKAMEDIVASIKDSDVYADVNIELKGMDEDQYEGELNKANASGNMPCIYEVPENFDLSAYDTEDLSGIIKEFSTKDYLFLGNYSKYFSDYNSLPTGFNVPVIYINQTLLPDVDFDGIDVKNMKTLMDLDDGNMQYMPMAIDPDIAENYSTIFDDFDDYKELMENSTKEDFLNGTAVAYFSDTSEYFEVRTALLGSAVMLPVNTKNVICMTENRFAITECDGAEEKAATKILSYFLSNNAQEIYYIQTSLPGLPMEKVALNKYYTVIRRQFSDVLANTDNFIFEK